MKKYLILALILVVVLLSAVQFGLASAKVAPVPLPKVSVAASTGEVKVKVIAANEWQNLKIGDEINQSDTIKTGNDGAASLNIYDKSIVHIGADSEVKLDELSINKEKFAETKISLYVSVGRIWARVINLADRNSSFEVSSDNTVATVRGTAFDFQVSSSTLTTVRGAENVIEVALIEKADKSKVIKKITITEGLEAVVSGKDKAGSTKIQPIPKVEKEGQWFKDSLAKDQKIKEEIKKQQEEQAKKIAGEERTKAEQYLQNAQLEIKKIFSSQEEAARLKASTLRQCLAESHKLSAEGDSAAGQAKFDDCREQIKAFYQEIDGFDATIKDSLKNEINNQLNLQKNILLNSPASADTASLRNKLEDLEISLATDKNEKDYLLFEKTKNLFQDAETIKSLDENKYNEIIQEAQKNMEAIKEAEEIDLSGYLELFQKISDIKTDSDNNENILDILNETDALKLLDLMPELKESLPELEESQLNDIKTIIDDTKIIIEKMITPIKTAEPLPEKTIIPEPLPEKTTISEPLPETIPATEPLIESLPEKIITPEPLPDQPAEITLISLSVSAKAYNMLAGEGMQLSATAYYSDGSTKNVTAQAVWKLSGDIGTISSGGYLQSSANGGSGIAGASYAENGKTVEANAPEITALTIGL